MGCDNGYICIQGQCAEDKDRYYFIRLVSRNSDINLKLNKGLKLLRKASNWYPHHGSLVENEFPVNSMVSVYPKQLHSVELSSTMVTRHWFRLRLQNFYLCHSLKWSSRF